MNNKFEIIRVDDKHWMKITDDTAFQSILEGYPEYEKVYLSLAENKNTCIQAGGYCGIFPRLLAKHFDIVYTFEPDHDNFHCLSVNCADSPNVIKWQAGLGSFRDMAKVIKNHPTNFGMHSIESTEANSVPIIRIDDIALSSCDLIALDTEGYEYDILIGAKETISNFNPVISVEDTNDKIESLLKSKGYAKHCDIYRDTIYVKADN